jgi:hypothetical protein
LRIEFFVETSRLVVTFNKNLHSEEEAAKIKVMLLRLSNKYI